MYHRLQSALLCALTVAMACSGSSEDGGTSTGGAGGIIPIYTSGSGGGTSTGGTGGGQCTYQASTPACTECVGSKCTTECAACMGNPACTALIGCLQGCGSDSQCANQCPSDHPGGAAYMLPFLGIGSGCVGLRCGSECGHGGGGGSGGGAGGTSTSGSGGSSGGGGTAENLCLQAINAARASVGAPALTFWSQQESCADSQAQVYSQGGTPNPQACGAWGATACGNMPAPPEASVQECINVFASNANAGSILRATTYTQVACGFFVNGNKVFMTQFFK